MEELRLVGEGRFDHPLIRAFPSHRRLYLAYLRGFGACVARMCAALNSDDSRGYLMDTTLGVPYIGSCGILQSRPRNGYIPVPLGFGVWIPEEHNQWIIMVKNNVYICKRSINSITVIKNN
jgi:hypothetical protein